MRASKCAAVCRSTYSSVRAHVGSREVERTGTACQGCVYVALSHGRRADSERTVRPHDTLYGAASLLDAMGGDVIIASPAKPPCPSGLLSL